MEQDNKKAAVYAIFIFGLIIICFEIFAGLKGVEPSGYVELIWEVAFTILSIYWIINDARVRKIGSPYTNGFIMYVLYPFMVPLYFSKTMRKKSIFLILGILIVFALPEILWFLAYEL
jgi:hypothetical protein